jgi:multidrug efflux pump subunit AcrA (membrane-fusion protein)
VEAIQAGSDGNSKFVLVIASDSTAHKKVVTLGIQTTEDVQILSGITASDMVISTGAYGLDENTKVKIGTDPNAKPDDDEKPSAGAPEPGSKPSGKDADDK